ncbi:hypothetical protein ACIPIA_14130, partial [Bosea sp. CER48]|uniref:hypothetical protein n=1 Tax=Bosea sp. CER48 TaxID=3377035 RepID=UPI0038244072
TRLDGDSWELAEVPLGEDSERYEIRVFNGAAAVHAEIVNRPEWIYPSAQELADFGSPQLELVVSLAQLGAAVGRGREWHGRIAVA